MNLCLFCQLTFVPALRHASLPLLFLVFSCQRETLRRVGDPVKGDLVPVGLELKPGVRDAGASQVYLSFSQMNFLSGISWVLFGFGFAEENTVHRLPIPGEGSTPFCPLHLGIGVAKENTIWSNTG